MKNSRLIRIKTENKILGRNQEVKMLMTTPKHSRPLTPTVQALAIGREGTPKTPLQQV
jgi:hypothetical protein